MAYLVRRWQNIGLYMEKNDCIVRKQPSTDPIRLEKCKKVFFHFYNFGCPKTCNPPPPAMSEIVWIWQTPPRGGQPDVLDGWPLRITMAKEAEIDFPQKYMIAARF